MYANFVTDILNTFTEPFSIWDCYIDDAVVGVVVISQVSVGLVLGLNGTLPVVDLGL